MYNSECTQQDRELQQAEIIRRSVISTPLVAGNIIPDFWEDPADAACAPWSAVSYVQGRQLWSDLGKPNMGTYERSLPMDWSCQDESTDAGITLHIFVKPPDFIFAAPEVEVQLGEPDSDIGDN